MTADAVQADILISGATLITMDAARRVIEDGAVAIAADRIVALGKREGLAREVSAREVFDARGFVMTPGFVDCHIHITGDPLTRGFRRGSQEDSWSDRLNKWTIPIFKAHTAEDEKLSAQCAALAMIRYGTTCFVEAGTMNHLDAVVEGLAQTGIRGRVGEWVEGRAFNPADDQAKKSAEAIAILESEIERYPDHRGDTLLAAWPILIGHSTNSDDIWCTAKALADEHGLRVSAHMSPRTGDPEWFLANTGRRPLEHLADIGVMDKNIMLTHLAAIDRSELDVLVESGASAIHCAHAAFQGGMGLSQSGLYPEMLERDVNVCLGTDGLAADILSSGRLMASVFRDARVNQYLFPPETILELMTLNGARAMGLSDLIGTLEVGKKADLVLHDTDLPEWGPVFDPAEQLAMSAPPHGVHSVWIDGVRVLEAGRSIMMDEEKLLADARQAGRAVIARTGLPNRTTWPVL